MSIKGYTDKAAALPILGELRKGAEKPKNGPGRDLDYFRFTSDDPAVISMFYSHYPKEPRQINAYFPYQTTDENFDCWIEKWVAGGLIYRSDGDTVNLWRMDNGAFSDEPKADPKPGELEDGKRKDGSQYVGRLSIIIPEMGRLATVTVLTTSKNDIINLSRQLRFFETLNSSLQGVPFIVLRKPKKISTPMGNGKRGRRESWLLSVETQPEWTRLKMLAMAQEALPEVEETLALPETIQAEYSVIERLPFSDPNEEMETEQPPQVQTNIDNAPSPTSKPTNASQPPKQKPAPTPQPTNNEPQEKSDPWPAKSGKVADFCNQVRRLTGDPDLNGTGYYNSQFHLSKALEGGFGNLSDQAIYDAKVTEAVDHAKQRADEEAAKEE